MAEPRRTGFYRNPNLKIKVIRDWPLAACIEQICGACSTQFAKRLQNKVFDKVEIQWAVVGTSPLYLGAFGSIRGFSNAHTSSSSKFRNVMH
jgi:hypothetical protein